MASINVPGRARYEARNSGHNNFREHFDVLKTEMIAMTEMLGATTEGRLDDMTGKAEDVKGDTITQMALMGVLTAICVLFLLTTATILLAEEIGLLNSCFAIGGVVGLLVLGVSLRHRSAQRLDEPAGAGRSANAATWIEKLVEAFMRGFMDGKR